MAEPIAIAFSDLHLSITAPACRADKDWLELQASYLEQIKQTAKGLPVLFAGDLFDRWNPPPELIHFALQNLPPNMICVPGQHDLPNHRIDMMHRSGYGVLKAAGKIIDISGSQLGPSGWGDAQFVVNGFGWEQDIIPPRIDKKWQHIPAIALIHRYFWTGDKGYPGAPEEFSVACCIKPLRGYDLAITGDNHKDFIAKAGNCTVVNCGGTIRRKSDEMERQPLMAVVFSDGTVKRKLFDTSVDCFHENAKEKEKESTLDLKSFIDSLEGLGEHGLNFREAVANHLRKEEVSPQVKQMVLTALEQQQ